MPVVDDALDEAEEEQEAVEPGMQYNFISKELMFTGGADGTNILGGLYRESNFGESTIMNEVSNQRDSNQRQVVDMDVTPDEEEREAVLDQ